MSAYRTPPAALGYDVEPDPFPSFPKSVEEALNLAKAKRMAKLLRIERAAHRLVRATRRADLARAGFPDSHELRQRCADSVVAAFVALDVALTGKP